VAEVDLPLSDRAQETLRRDGARDDLDQALEIVQQAIAEAREHLADLSRTLEEIAAEIARRTA
jgi:hypothetical protein